ncbi:3-oxo-glucose-6-phosphate:glutamate aminotransferase [mine drainage metagenome]|uniref:3-oxo-glucose-6-phosphate:glutamate aminotransferase n=1 Tax=mine drainage metagenome TaxID=410659 RepID=A0A1J5R4J7_9ZZZZ
MSKSPSELKAEILRLTREYSSLVHRANRPAWDNPAPFVPGTSSIPYAGRVFTEDEVEAAVSSTLDFWLTLGPEGEAFEKELATLMGVKYSLLVNSGSSANLIAICALTTHKLPKERRILPGDEVITVAAGFPTTVAPIIQVGAVPVFIDNDPVTGNARVDMLEEAYVEGKTKAVMMAHTLGNPFDIGAVLEFCRKHNLWLIEDNCDSLGSTYTMPLERAKRLGVDHLIKIAETGSHPTIRLHGPNSEILTAEILKSEQAQSPNLKFSESHIFLTAPTGSWGDLSTQSFYPPHHLTLGEGGAVNIVSKPALKTYAESFRDWGRDCWCASGKDNTCHKRFDWQLGELPKGYDHKYIYSHLGYNLKPLDIQAAIGRQQLKKLPAFVEARKRNWERLRAGLAGLEEHLDFSLPTHASGWRPDAVLASSSSSSNGTKISDSSNLGISEFAWDSSRSRTNPSWFGFMIRVKSGAPISSSQLGRLLDENKIGTRMLFGGNLVRQPVFVQLRKDRPQAYRVSGELHGADQIMGQAIFLGTYPALTEEQLNYVIRSVHQAFDSGN